MERFLAEAAKTVDGAGMLSVQLAGMTVGWGALFYLLSSTTRCWMRNVPPSTKEHENDKYWCARNLIGAIHALLIAAITVPAYFFMAFGGVPENERFAYSRDLEVCSPGAEFPRAQENPLLFTAIAFAGLAFTAFTLADVVISVFHGLAGVDYIVHHVAFITAGAIIRGNCMLPFNAAILLGMEVSTPSLNFLLFFRHRGDAYESAVARNGIVFVLLYVMFRLGLNIYGFIILVLNKEKAMPPSVPEWQAWFLIIAVGAGVAVQLFWFPGIARTFGNGLRGLFKRSSDDSEGTDSSDSPAGHLAGAEASD
eukprot:TRINITY_DN14208_c0_g1_i1.p1 TRINITY_DN14208_c0_g1~~TRINITY_DN14208_c0_g1_i1.p1  ORF type:complete len:310 (-),score=47.45 TRINITY_DN14208_c0_g1_i1:253-1182(-)